MNESSVHDDRMTMTAVAALAYMLQCMLHEGIGHGVTAWLSGSRTMTLSTVALSSDLSTRWISANGTLVNLAAGAVLWLVLRRMQRSESTARYFLVLAYAGNLFTGTGYFLFSGVAGFGDWEAVIRGLQPYWMYRVALIGVGLVSYFAAVWLVARELGPYRRDSDKERLKNLTWTPYYAEGALAAMAGLMNPLGPIYVLLSALPATLGANSALLWIRHYVPVRADGREAKAIARSYGWIAAALLLGAYFIFVIGRGISFQRA